MKFRSLSYMHVLFVCRMPGILNQYHLHLFFDPVRTELNSSWLLVCVGC